MILRWARNQANPNEWYTWDYSDAYKGQDCFLCCPGPSLADVDTEALKGPGRFVFAVNTAYPKVKNPDLWMGMDAIPCYDRKVWSEGFPKIAGNKYADEPIGGKTLKEMPNTCFMQGGPAPPCEIFTRRGHQAMHVWNGNVFESAIHIAVWLGAKRVFFLGCDMGGERDYHDDRTLGDEHRQRNKALYRRLVPTLGFINACARHYGVKLVSCTPGSPINSFLPYISVEGAIKKAEADLPKFAEAPIDPGQHAELTRWGPKPTVPEGVMTGCDAPHEWLLSWWYANLREHNPDVPVCFADYGMGAEVRKWCLERGAVLQVPLPVDVWHKKPFALLHTPFEKTLWLDADCEVRADLRPVLDKVERLSLTLDPHNPWCKATFGGAAVASGLVGYLHGDDLIATWARRLLKGMPAEYSGTLPYWRDQEGLNATLHSTEAEFILLDPRCQRLRLDGDTEPNALVMHWTGPEGKEIIRQKMQDVPAPVVVPDSGGGRIQDYWREHATQQVSPNFGDYPEGWDVGTLLQHIIGHATVADFGCGAGRLAGVFAKEKYVGVDISPGAIAQARADWADYEFRVGELYPLADVYLLYTVLLHYPDDGVRRIVQQIRDAGADRILVAEILGREWRREGQPLVFNRELAEYEALMAECGFRLADQFHRPHARYADDPNFLQKNKNISFLVFERDRGKGDAPLVSILMPAHDAGKYIGAAVESCRAQTYQNWELCVCDDGSTDDTSALLKSHETDNRIRVVHAAHLGYSRAFNHSLAMARGQIVARLDADDLQDPTRIEKQVAVLQSGADIATCAEHDIGSAGVVIRRRACEPMEPRKYVTQWATGQWQSALNPIGPSIVAWKRVYDAVGPFDSHNFGPDSRWNFRAIAKGMTWGHVDEPLYFYRRNPGQMTGHATTEDYALIESAAESCRAEMGW